MKTEIENNRKQHVFQVFFLKNNITQDRQEFELQNIDFDGVKKHLENGESVYITSKQEKRSNVKFIAYERLNEPWYFVRS
jgi:hypothetical protein